MGSGYPGELTQLTASCSLMQRRLHALRYVMKNKDTGDVLFVVVFTLVPREEAERGEGRTEGEPEVEEERVEPRVAVKDGGEKGKEMFEPKEDDLD